MHPNFDNLLKVLNREIPEKVPLYEHIVDNLMMKAVLHKKPPHIGGIGNILKKKENYMKYLIDFFGGLGYDYIPLELGMKLFRINLIQGNYNEALGSKTRGWVDDHRSTIANQEEFDEYIWPEPEDAVDYELLKAAKNVLPKGMKLVSGVGGGVLEHVMWLVGLIPLSRAMKRDPKFVRNMFDKVGQLIEEVDKIIVEEDIVGAMRMGDDMGYKSGTMLNPKDMRKYVFPWQKKIVEVSHRKGKPFILHSCGNLEEIIEDLLEYVKIDAWHSFQDIILPVTEAKKQYGDRVAILGGVDIDILSRGTPEEVINYSKPILLECKRSGGYAFGSGNSIPSYIKKENYLAMIEIGKKYGSYSV